MPKISAATVAEHRATRERELLDAARRLLVDHGAPAVTIGAVADEVGLTRTAVYKYFTSGPDLCRRIVEESFQAWADRVATAVEAEEGPDQRIEAYVTTTLALASAGAHRVAVAAGELGTTDDDLARQHRRLSEPLAEALAAKGLHQPTLSAELIDGLLGRAIAEIDRGTPPTTVTATAMELVRRAVG